MERGPTALIGAKQHPSQLGNDFVRLGFGAPTTIRSGSDARSVIFDDLHEALGARKR
ncbi:MAG TPA: hypothetical protein VLV78_11300 [Thermoanaerobaculia bacterium]|nr:hypothetical protein [Thermoanaerobaculia bacterium]